MKTPFTITIPGGLPAESRDLFQRCKETAANLLAAKSVAEQKVADIRERQELAAKECAALAARAQSNLDDLEAIRELPSRRAQLEMFPQAIREAQAGVQKIVADMMQTVRVLRAHFRELVQSQQDAALERITDGLELFALRERAWSKQGAMQTQVYQTLLHYLASAARYPLTPESVETELEEKLQRADAALESGLVWVCTGPHAGL